MLNMRNLTCGLTVLLVASCVAQADIIYSSKAAWAGALSGSPTTINFGGIPLPQPQNDAFYGSGPGSSVTVGGVSFAIGPAGTDSLLFVVGPNYYSDPVAEISEQDTESTSLAPPDDLLITLPSAVTAFGFDFGGLFTGDTATVTLSDGSVQMVAAPAPPNLAFFGVTAPGGITSVDITLPGDTYGLDMTDFSYGTAATTSTVPEPSPLLLFGTVLVLAGASVRRSGGCRISGDKG